METSKVPNPHIKDHGIWKPSKKIKGKWKTPWIDNDGIILVADIRTIEGPTITDKNCEKIHCMVLNIYCCGARTAADTESVIGQLTAATASLLYWSRIKVFIALTLLKNHLSK
ncbi:hypothetical protein I3842_16G070500 [Carya illinoinensis]|uniref:Uncharacterized protein n=1 Tax=Carya illinoinensis TaxID=32201 RepID=A0A922A5D0_CARIL|nr:hypothetical protein I3842_16G070500 [Carya illinoinensis]